MLLASGMMPESLGVQEWWSSHGLQMVLILAGAAGAYELGASIIRQMVHHTVGMQQYPTPEAKIKTEKTISRVLSNVLKAAVWLIALMMIMSEVGLNTGPLLAGAGVVGLALSFGGQELMKDVIAGLFIMLENQYRVGDVVCLDGTCGLVEDITLRLTVLRDMDGVVHHIRNGEMKVASNMSKDFSRVYMDIRVPSAADLNKVTQLVNQVGQELAADPAWKDAVLKAPQFLRITDFSNGAVVLKISGDTQAQKQWDVSGEFRRRLKLAFDRESIALM